MLATIKHQDIGLLVVVAKLLTGYIKTTEKIVDPDSYIKVNSTFDAQFVSYVVSWQTNHGCTPDGVIGPDTWKAIAKAAPTCSTAKNRISGYTRALQILLDSNLTCDAIYGSRTKAAVAVFQEAHKEKADGICGPKTWNAVIVGDQPTPEPTPGKFVKPKDFKQASKPWGPKMYSNHNDPNQTMANSGCGPTSMAMIIATWIDPAITPVQMCSLSVEHGFRTKDKGTEWAFYKYVYEHTNGFKKFIPTSSIATLKSALRQGALAVCSMNSNDNNFWTKGGHFIAVCGVDDKYIYANDPNKTAHPRKQKLSKFKTCLKQAFIFWK